MRKTAALALVGLALAIIGYLVMQDITGALVGSLVGLKPLNDKISRKRGKAKTHSELREYELDESLKKHQQADKLREQSHRESEDVTPTPEDKTKTRKTFRIG